MLMVGSMRQSQQLARQQMEFVATVSHELRTPLAVVRPPADNLAEGVVPGAGAGPQVRRAGEGRRPAADGNGRAESSSSPAFILDSGRCTSRRCASTRCSTGAQRVGDPDRRPIRVDVGPRPSPGRRGRGRARAACSRTWSATRSSTAPRAGGLASRSGPHGARCACRRRPRHRHRPRRSRRGSSIRSTGPPTWSRRRFRGRASVSAWCIGSWGARRKDRGPERQGRRQPVHRPSARRRRQPGASRGRSDPADAAPRPS